MKNFLAAAAASLTLTSFAFAADEPAVDLSVAPAGAYVADSAHHYLTATYTHLGLSHPHFIWRDWSADLAWDPKNLEKSTIKTTINAASVQTGSDVFDGHMKGANFFDAEQFPTITFVSNKIERTGPNTGKISGDLTVKGVTKPVTLDAHINGALFMPSREDPTTGVYRLGFSATTKIKRSDFGLSIGVPYVSDDVEIAIDTEFQSAAPVKVKAPKSKKK